MTDEAEDVFCVFHDVTSTSTLLCLMTNLQQPKRHIHRVIFMGTAAAGGGAGSA
jgi:hypothetical protein